MEDSIDKLYQDKDLVQFYDYDNPWSASNDVIANWIKPTDSVLDIGCGTGTLAAYLATKCTDIYALDIAQEMLDVAKEKSAAVKWIHAGATDFVIDKKFDFIFLSGHSFQTLLHNVDRLALLKNIKNHLKEGGTFVFDTRNPLVEEWTTWGEEDSIRYFKHPHHGILKSWNDWHAFGEVITYQTYYQVLHTETVWKAASKIAFPTHENVALLIAEAGLKINYCYGSWQLEKYTDTSEEMIFRGTIAETY